MHKDRLFTVCIQTEFNDHYLLCNLCTNCHWDAQNIQCSFCKYESILAWWLLIVLDHVKSEFSSSVNLTTSHHHHVVTLFTALIITISDVTLLISYDYLSAENVLSTVKKLKMTAEILCCQAEKLNVDVFIALLTSLSYLYQLCFCLSSHCYSEQ